MDPVFYKSLHDLIEMEDVEYACLDFTTMEECMGAVNVVPLLPDGANIDVTSENLIQYLEVRHGSRKLHHRRQFVLFD